MMGLEALGKDGTAVHHVELPLMGGLLEDDGTVVHQIELLLLGGTLEVDGTAAC
jgi:hypothetical protein